MTHLRRLAALLACFLPASLVAQTPITGVRLGVPLGASLFGALVMPTPSRFAGPNGPFIGAEVSPYGAALSSGRVVTGPAGAMTTQLSLLRTSGARFTAEPYHTYYGATQRFVFGSATLGFGTYFQVAGPPHGTFLLLSATAGLGY